MERIQKIIANSGYASRRKAEELIKQGRVTVNGEISARLGQKASYADTIMIDGEALKKRIRNIFYFINLEVLLLQVVMINIGKL